MKFETETRWFKRRHPFVWRRVEREIKVQSRLYNAIAGTLKAHGIHDERGANHEDEPSYDLMVAVLRVLKRENIKF